MLQQTTPHVVAYNEEAAGDAGSSVDIELVDVTRSGGSELVQRCESIAERTGQPEFV